MTRTPDLALPAVDARLARTLWQWLALGALALLAWPAARGQTGLLGWGPYWAVVAPALALVVAYRHRLIAHRGELAPPATAHRRRARPARGQAQRAPASRRERHLRVA
ncbi:MAG: hypothetical protein ACREO3_11545 [Arenimonas sp.]